MTRYLKDSRGLEVRWSKREKDLVVDGRAPGPDRAWVIYRIGILAGELEARGYEVSTLHFAVKHKNQGGCEAEPVTK